MRRRYDGYGVVEQPYGEVDHRKPEAMQPINPNGSRIILPFKLASWVIIISVYVWTIESTIKLAVSQFEVEAIVY